MVSLALFKTSRRERVIGTFARSAVDCVHRSVALMALYAAEGIVIAIMDLNEPMAALFLTDEVGPLPADRR